MTQREMAESWLRKVRQDIATRERELATLKRHEQECVQALSEQNGQVNRVNETADV